MYDNMFIFTLHILRGRFYPKYSRTYFIGALPNVVEGCIYFEWAFRTSRAQLYFYNDHGESIMSAVNDSDNDRQQYLCLQWAYLKISRFDVRFGLGQIKCLPIAAFYISKQ